MALAEQQQSLVMNRAGWYQDPDGIHELRYYDGTAWTAHATHNGPTPCRGCRFDDLGVV